LWEQTAGYRHYNHHTDLPQVSNPGTHAEFVGREITLNIKSNDSVPCPIEVLGLPFVGYTTQQRCILTREHTAKKPELHSNKLFRNMNFILATEFLCPSVMHNQLHNEID
jgi:hypothetical protein